MDIEAKVRLLEDRAEISETVIRYAISLDRCDWELFTSCLTDEILIDFSEWSGMEPRTWRAEEWVAFAREALSGFEGRQHISPNHVVTIDGDEAVCLSYMFAQHYLPGAPGGDSLLMHGYYTNKLRRTPHGWRIHSMQQHVTWQEGNEAIFDAARERFEQTSD